MCMYRSNSPTVLVAQRFRNLQRPFRVRILLRTLPLMTREETSITQKLWVGFAHHSWLAEPFKAKSPWTRALGWRPCAACFPSNPPCVSSRFLMAMARHETADPACVHAALLHTNHYLALSVPTVPRRTLSDKLVARHASSRSRGFCEARQGVIGLASERCL